MFTLTALPFDEAALEPIMSRDTLATHHGKHHAGYVKKTNEALEERADPLGRLEEVVRLAARERDAKLFNNAAQAWNHGFFWNSLSAEQHDLEGDLQRALERQFGSIDALKDQFVARGEAHFASGWLWLVSDTSGALRLEDMHDAGTPITGDGATPLLVCDLWEHAYYLDHKNARGAFLRGFVDRLANWRFAASQYAAAQAGEQGWTYPA